MLHRNLIASLLLIGLAAAGCGGGKHGSTAGIPGGGNTNGTGGTTPGGGTNAASSATLSIGSDVTIAMGRSHQFQAFLEQDGAVDDCSATGQWTSSDPAVASVSGGVVTTLGLGQTTITASCAGVDDAAILVVTAAEVVSIAVTPAAGELPVGLSEQLTAIATLTDATTADVTGDVVWTSSNIDAFAFSTDPGSPGVLTAKAPAGESSTITALHASGVFASVTRTVTAATLASIVLAPLDHTGPLGLDVQLHATGTFSDGQSADVSPSVTWTSSPAGIASFTSNPGLATTLATGTTTITATRGAISASTSLTVTAPVVTSIAIDQQAATLVAGEILQLTGTAIFSDDSTQAVSLTGWTSSVPGVARVSGAGVLTAVAPGFATVRASYVADGQTFTDSTQVNVIAPTASPVLSYLSLTPGSVKGGGRPLNVTVALTARATADTVVTLASSDPVHVPVPATVTIAGGKSSYQFKVTTTRSATKQKVKITATLGGATKVATLNLRN